MVQFDSPNSFLSFLRPRRLPRKVFFFGLSTSMDASGVPDSLASTVGASTDAFTTGRSGVSTSANVTAGASAAGTLGTSASVHSNTCWTLCTAVDQLMQQDKEKCWKSGRASLPCRNHFESSHCGANVFITLCSLEHACIHGDSTKQYNNTHAILLSQEQASGTELCDEDFVGAPMPGTSAEIPGMEVLMAGSARDASGILVSGRVVSTVDLISGDGTPVSAANHTFQNCEKASPFQNCEKASP
jgi:hypothetical protein